MPCASITQRSRLVSARLAPATSLGSEDARIGTALLEAVRAELKRLGVTELSLHVLANNQEVMRFYERHGFEPFAIWLRAV